MLRSSVFHPFLLSMYERFSASHLDETLGDISFGPDLPTIPERLLLAHARGEVLFLCGAGISRSAGMPGFRELVSNVYQTLDPVIHAELPNASSTEDCRRDPHLPQLTPRQAAEVRRFKAEEFDVVLGMLERRLDSRKREDSKVRSRVAEVLRQPEAPNALQTPPPAESVGKTDRAGMPRPICPAPVHRTLIRLADRGGVSTIMTTNFDLLLEAAAKGLRVPLQTYALGSIPRPTRRNEFAGVLHLHGALSRDPCRFSDLVLTDQDFGEFYLRRRIVPDLIYDAARLFHLVMVGYSAKDPPMRYLLDAVAADEARFEDLKDRFIFIDADGADPVAIEDWRTRGITPIQYSAPNEDHSALYQTLDRWADLSAINGKRQAAEKEIRRIVMTDRAATPEADRRLFDHLFRRSNAGERVHLAASASAAGADIAWLDAIMNISDERDREQRR